MTKSDSYGRVSVNRIFEGELDASVEQLRQLAPVVVRHSSSELLTYTQLEADESLDPQPLQGIATESTAPSEIADESEQKSAEHSQPAITQQLQPSFTQTGRAERVIAGFLDEAGLSEVAMSGNLHMTVQTKDQSSLRLDINEVKEARILSIRQGEQPGGVRPAYR